MSARDRVVILLRRVATLCRIQRSTRHSRIVAIYAWRPIWHPFAENWSIISFPRFREFEETRSHNGGGGGMPHRVAPQRKISPITITTFATLLCVCPAAGRPVVGRSVVRPNRIILYLSHDSCRSTPQRSERRVYRSVKCKLPGNVNKTFNVVSIVVKWRMRRCESPW